VAKAKNGTSAVALNEVSKAKTADDLNCIIAKHVDILDKPGATLQDRLMAATISALIGRQISIENVKISYERLSMANKKTYRFCDRNG
jgi:hypothetical protein